MKKILIELDAELHRKLKTKAKNDILILTDTKVFFKEDTIFHLIKHFKKG